MNVATVTMACHRVGTRFEWHYDGEFMRDGGRTRTRVKWRGVEPTVEGAFAASCDLARENGWDGVIVGREERVLGMRVIYDRDVPRGRIYLQRAP